MPRATSTRSLVAFLVSCSLAVNQFGPELTSAAVWADGTVTETDPATAVKPNVVIILADDFGYGSANAYGAPETLVKTPNLDRLAKEGKRFTQAYTGSSVCSPTRYGLLTGQYAFRTSLKRGVLNTFAPLHIQPGQLNVASLLDQQGYNTAAIGKWHLGYGNARSLDGRTDYKAKLSPGPLEIGFDYHFGVPSNHGDLTGVFVEDHYVYGLKSGKFAEGESAASPAENDERFQSSYDKSATEAKRLDGIEIDAPRRKNDRVMDVLTDKAVQWLSKQSNEQPFLLYYTPVAVHNPVTPSPEVAGSSPAGVYGDWIHELDRSVGAVLNTLDQQGLSENTIVLFTSDNGGVYRPNNKNLVQTQAYEKGLKVNGELRGGKHTIFEGGFRVPYVVRWPGKVQAGATSDQIVSLVDIVATLATVTGQELPSVADAAQDSHSVANVWTGEDKATGRPDVIVHSAEGVFAIRQGDWKWIEGIPAPGVNYASGNNANREEEHRPQLYNLATDPSETQDVSGAHPEIVEKLQGLLVTYRDGGYSRELPVFSKSQVASGIPAINAPVNELPNEPWRIARGKWEPKEGALQGSASGNQTAALAITLPVGEGAEPVKSYRIQYEAQLRDAERLTVRADASNNQSYRFDLNEKGIQIVKNDSDGRDGPDKQENWGTAEASIGAGDWYAVELVIGEKKARFQLKGEGTELVVETEKDLLGESPTSLSWVIAGGSASIRNLTVQSIP